MGVFWNGTPGFGALEPLWLGCAFGAYDCLMPVAPSAGGCQEGARRGLRMVPLRIQGPIWTPNVSNLDLRTQIWTKFSDFGVPGSQNGSIWPNPNIRMTNLENTSRSFFWNIV